MPALSESLRFTTYTNTGSVQVVYPLYSTSSRTLVYTSDRAKGDGYYGSSDGFHTAMYTYDTNFVGTITMQATLATDPVESDWFNLSNTTVVANTSTPGYNNAVITATCVYSNFIGNFVWVRGYVAIQAGQLGSVLYNH